MNHYKTLQELVLKSEGKTLEDELRMKHCKLFNIFTKQIVEINYQLCSSGDTGVYLQAGRKKILRWQVVDSNYGYDVDGEEVTSQYEILGRELSLERILMALNMKDEYGIKADGYLIITIGEGKYEVIDPKIDLYKPLSEQPEVCEKLCELLK